MTKACSFFAAALLVTLAPMASADQLAANPGFETAGAGGATESANWTSVAAGAAGTISVRDGSSPRTGAFAQHLMAVGAVGMGADAIISQNSIGNGGLPSLQENTTLSASFNAKVAVGPGGVVFHQLKILNGAGQIVTQTGLGVITSGTAGAYQTFSTATINVPAFGAAPNDVYAALLEIKGSAGAFVGSNADVYVDDVTITGTLVGGAQNGACCAAGGACTVNTQAACTGAYQGNGTSCSPNPCAQPMGACCAISGDCTVGTQASCTGTYQGTGSTCTPNPCPIPTQIAFNGGFETAGFGGATDSFGWNTAVSGAPGSLSQRDGTMPRTGGFAQHLIALGGDGIGANSAIFQNSVADGGLNSLQQNTTLSATFAAKLTLGPGGVGFYKLSILNGAGEIVASTGLGVITSGTGGVYQTYSTAPLTVPAFGAPPNDAYAAFVEINVAAGAFVGATAEAYIDDVSIFGTVTTGEQTGACCVAGACSVTTQAACGGVYQGNGSTCTPSPCAPATGACCCGSSCTVTEAAACTGTNRAFAGTGTACAPISNTVPCCRGDYNKSGSPASVQDIFDFLAGYFGSDSCADSNDSGAISVQDIFDFLSAYFGGCV